MELKQLTFDQYEQARAAAVERVKARIGAKPMRDQFKRELGSIWTPLDTLAMIVFAAAFAISSAHIITHMGKLAASSYRADYVGGIIFSAEMYILFHQVGMIFLAEASMILFMVLHGISSADRIGRAAWARQASMPLALAIVAAVFVFLANVQSGIGILESIMPPIFTVGIGLRLERLIVDLIERRRQIDQKYLGAMDIYESASADPERHPDFERVLRQSVWEKLISLPSNKAYRDAPAAFKAAAVRRETERDSWTHLPGDVATAAWHPEPGGAASERPTSARRGRKDTSGNTAPDQADDDDTQPTEQVPSPNGYMPTASAN
ncbi:MAG: hypothetical protein SF162_07540 [bacterium]|nr:hypothetical protein [bacterium]